MNTGGNGSNHQQQQHPRPQKKPPARVLDLKGAPLAPDEITDADYQHAIDLQDARLFAEGKERRFLGQLRVRLERGAGDKGERYYFDLERGIVRRKHPKQNAS